MSTQSSQAVRLSLEAVGNGDHLVFGDDAHSSLAIPKVLMGQLWAQVNDGVRRLSRGGLEVGGLLVGPKVRGNRVVVDGIVPLPIEYRHGPSYQMSSSDLANIAPAIESVQEDLSRTVVGFYRSRTRDDKTLRESDQEILDAVEATHSSLADFRCCFILAPTSESVGLACIAMRNGAGWNELPPYTVRANPPSIIAFPPSTALLQVTRNVQAEESAIQLPVSSSAAQPVVEHRAAPSVAKPIKASRIKTSHIAASLIGAWRAIVAYALAGLIAIGATGLYLQSVRNQPAPVQAVAAKAPAPRAHLGFSATLESPVWKLTWDRAAMDELNPVGAVLFIVDGGNERQVALAPPDLASGIIFYTPQTSDLSFSLRIDRGGTTVEENVRVLGAAPKNFARPMDRPPQPVATNAPGQPPKADSRVVAPPVVQPPKPAAFNPVVTPAKPNAGTAPAAAPSKDLPPAPLPQQTVTTLAVPVPPTFDPRAAAPPPAPVSQPVTQPVTQVAKPPVNQPSVTTPPVTPPAAAPSTASTAAPVPSPQPAAPAPATYVGPRPVQQVALKVPANVPTNVSQVQVMVEIDARGKVTRTNPVAWNGQNASLMVLATRAASGWVFAPAQSNGQAVPSQMILTFRIDNQPPR